ncbi:HlyD family efflux transporter periplasmic adaptor subunit [Phytohabitans sp. ZYX-F-186]|uniref:HlyD family efflux transporter periplasmic adaptor subunit n=1 Tax=Phytohabitans maris TaxID=3071409 RepID=A0ABU0ZCD7_9ACTN|nr:HlyD family efflux transporter periplasmic adaptor subunit [Phytohabitans sp. ZYX-F-186]MDQ7903992.1 HlyD family efflux transporter periplasmic adaptor subunit [Phytohabitans sp. ZYX-F-186]
MLVLLGVAIAGGIYIARDRLAEGRYVELGHAVLTARPVPVGSAAAGTVKSVKAAPQTEASAGDELARVTVTAPDGDPEEKVLRAPIDGIVSDVDAAAGGVAGPGQPVVTLYDPAKLTFNADASVEELRRLRLDMAASITAKGLDDPIAARLDRVVPRVGDTRASEAFTVVLVPDQGERGTVRKLVPGLPFTVRIDTRTAAGGTPAVNSGR